MVLWDTPEVRPHRVRLAGVAYLLCPPRQPGPSSGRLLRAREFRRLLLAHRSNLRLRAIVREHSDPRAERRRHEGRHPPVQAITALAEVLRCYELPTAPPRLAPVILEDFSPLPYEPPEPGPMFDERAHWVEVCIVGENDEPLPGVACEITLPSGKVVRRRSDRHGLVRIEGITTPGACSLSLPGRHENAWAPA